MPSSSNFSIQPLLPPRISDDVASYTGYLAAYDLYVSKVHGVRTDAAAARAASKAARVPKVPAKAPTPPALPAKTRETIGAAFSEGKKFGSLEFPTSELSAARKRWQTLSERRGGRARRGLNGRERRELNELRPIAAKGSYSQDCVDVWEKDLFPSVKRIFKKVGEDLSAMTLQGAPVEVIGGRRVDQFHKSVAVSANTFTQARAQHVARKVEALVSPAPATASADAKLANLAAKTALARAEADLKSAQAETQRRRAQLKKTVTEKVTAHIVQSSGSSTTRVMMVPETTSVVESVLEAAAASVETEPREKLPMSFVDVERLPQSGSIAGQSFYLADVRSTERAGRRRVQIEDVFDRG